MPRPSALHTLQLVLFKPGRFFEERPPRRSLGGAIGVVLLSALLVTIGAAILARVLVAQIDVTITETVMEPWSDQQCAGFDDHTPRPCEIDEPVTREVDVGEMIWGELLSLFPLMFIAVVISWIFIAIGLHLVSAILGGNGSFGATLSVAGWGMLPIVFSMFAGVVQSYFVLRGMDFANDPEVLLEQMELLAETGIGFGGVAISLVTAVWQGYIWLHGLRHGRDLSYEQALIAAGVVVVLMLLLELR